MLPTMTPDEVVDQVRRSGLRGRGGAGFPTGLKWATVAKAVGDRKFVICNADEGDPGAFMDRSVLESDPHRVLEGMAIAGYAVGARQGYIYCRGEYPLAIGRLHDRDRPGAAAPGCSAAGSATHAFDFEIDIRLGAGAFVCGEETALIASIEGRRGTPRPRPPYPAEAGSGGCPTLINNVETFANVPPIIRNGADWFAGIGTEKSKGTKVFALTGKVVNTGLIEVPMGMTLRADRRGHRRRHRRRPHVQGGADRRRRPAAASRPTCSTLPVDYESLPRSGSIMGSGGMIVMDDTICMVDVARFFMEFCRDESCGKCIPCRVGTVQMHRLLTRIAEGHGDARPTWTGSRGSATWSSRTSLCGLGQAAPNPVLSTLRYFREEYLAHIHGPRTLPGRGLPAWPTSGRPCHDRRARPHHRRHGERRRRATGRRSSRSPASTASPSRRCATSTGSATSAPAGSAWSRSRGAEQLLPACVTRGRRGHGGDRTLGAARRVPADDRRAAVRRAQPHLLGLRGQRPLRAPGPGRSTSAWTTSSCRRSNPDVGVDASHPLFGIDHNRCILCTRCVRVCDEIEGAHTWDVAGRGTDARVITDLDQPVGRRRRPAPPAASACRSARPARCSRRAAPWPRGAKHRRPFLPVPA